MSDDYGFYNDIILNRSLLYTHSNIKVIRVSEGPHCVLREIDIFAFWIFLSKRVDIRSIIRK